MNGRGASGRRVRAAGLIVLSAIVVFYAALALMAIVLTPRSIFPVPDPTYDERAEVGQLPLASGGFVSAVQLPRSDARYALLYAHGNREDLGMVGDRLEQLRQAGFTVLAVDYPGYGTSDGRPSEEGSYEALRALYDYARNELGYPPARIVVYGKALGGALAVRLAVEEPVAGVAIENTPVSAFRLIPILRILPWDHYDSSKRIREVAVPLFIVHGTEDEVIPLGQSRWLLDQATTTTLHLWVEGAGHDDIVEVAGEIYWSAFERFMILVEALPP